MTSPAPDQDLQDENRVLLALVHATSSLPLEELASRLEIGDARLRRALERLHERNYVQISHGLGPIADTYILTPAARAYIRRQMPGADVPPSSSGSTTSWRRPA